MTKKKTTKKTTTKAASKSTKAKAASKASGKKTGGGITEANKADAVNAAMMAVEADKKKRSSGLNAAAPVAAKAKQATKDAKSGTGRDTGKRGAAGGQRDANDVKPMSLLDAAAHLLSLGTGDPMRCKDIVDLATQRGLWAPRNGGKTPANSLHAAIQREIETKGQASRFVKANRGKFALAAKA